VPPPLPKAARTPTAADLPPLPEMGRRSSGSQMAVGDRAGGSLPPAIQAARVAPVSMPAKPSPAPLPPPPLPPPLAPLDDDILGQTNPGPPDLPTIDQGPRPTLSAVNMSAALEQAGGADQLSAIVQQQSTPAGEQAYFHQVYEDFIELKRKCGESIENLTFEKFAQKLTQNRDSLVAKYACRAVKFQVYVKDGKAALKATPVKG
jgi:hypothetical protein